MVEPRRDGRVRVAVVGAGHWGPNLIRNFHDSRWSTLLIVADRDVHRLEQVSARYPTVDVTSSFDEIVCNSEVEAVVIATPTRTHGPLAKSALEAGKHVLVEKPLAAAISEAEELCRIATDRSLVLMVGHVFIYNTAVQRVRHLIQSGALGRIYYLSMIRTNLGPIRIDVNAAWDLASHDLSIANYWLNAEPLSVSAMSGSWINKGLDDAVFATLRYPDNILVNLHASWLNPRKAREITVVGDERMLTLDDMSLSEPLRIFDKQVTRARMSPGFVDTFASFRAGVRDGDITIPKVASGEPLGAECEHFLECVRARQQPVTDGYAGMRVVRALEAIDRSVKNRGSEEAIR